MSWGISLLRGDTGGLIIDQNYPGHYLDATSPRHVSGYSYAVTSTPSGQNPYLHGYHLDIPGLDISGTDVIFYRPAGRNTNLPGNVGHAAFEIITGNPSRRKSIRTPCYVLHLKSLASHPHPLTDWGVAVFTPGGAQSFNSSAWDKRLEIVTSGFTGTSGWNPLLAGVWGEYLLLSPSDSINNYYALIAPTYMEYMATDENLFPFRGVRYRYDYGLNQIYLEGSPNQAYYFCIAKVVG